MRRLIVSLLVAVVMFSVLGCESGSDATSPISESERKPLDAASIERMKGATGTPPGKK